MHLDNLLFILLIAAAALLRLLAKKASESRESETPTQTSTSLPRTNVPPTRSPAETDEERIRRFLEALGQPSKPPAPVAPRPTYQKPVVLPHVPPFGSPLPPLTTRPPELPRKVQLPREVTLTPQTRKQSYPASGEAVFEVREAQPQPVPQSVTVAPAPEFKEISEEIAAPDKESDIASLLSSTSGLRDAIIVREILGRPRGLQPPDFLSAS